MTYKEATNLDEGKRFLIPIILNSHWKHDFNYVTYACAMHTIGIKIRSK